MNGRNDEMNERFPHVVEWQPDPRIAEWREFNRYADRAEAEDRVASIRKSGFRARLQVAAS